jgi:hypothetical protein
MGDCYSAQRGGERRSRIDLGRLPAHGVTAVVGVVPWQEGSGGPARVLATY